MKTTINLASVDACSYNRNSFNYIQTRCSIYNPLRTMCSTSVALIRASQLQELVMKNYYLLNAIRKKINANFRGRSGLYQKFACKSTDKPANKHSNTQ